MQHTFWFAARSAAEEYEATAFESIVEWGGCGDPSHAGTLGSRYFQRKRESDLAAFGDGKQGGEAFDCGRRLDFNDRGFGTRQIGGGLLDEFYELRVCPCSPSFEASSALGVGLQF